MHQHTNYRVPRAQVQENWNETRSNRYIPPHYPRISYNIHQDTIHKVSKVQAKKSLNKTPSATARNYKPSSPHLPYHTTLQLHLTTIPKPPYHNTKPPNPNPYITKKGAFQKHETAPHSHRSRREGRKDGSRRRSRDGTCHARNAVPFLGCVSVWRGCVCYVLLGNGDWDWELDLKLGSGIRIEMGNWEIARD